MADKDQVDSADESTPAELPDPATSLEPDPDRRNGEHPEDGADVVELDADDEIAAEFDETDDDALAEPDELVDTDGRTEPNDVDDSAGDDLDGDDSDAKVLEPAGVGAAAASRSHLPYGAEARGTKPEGHRDQEARPDRQPERTGPVKFVKHRSASYARWSTPRASS